MNADRLNEIREMVEAWPEEWTEGQDGTIRFLLAALDAAEQRAADAKATLADAPGFPELQARAVQAEHERDADRGFGQGLPPAGGWKRHMVEDNEYSPDHQDEYRRLWQRDAARAEAAEQERDEARSEALAWQRERNVTVREATERAEAADARATKATNALNAVAEDEGWNGLTGPTQSAVFDAFPVADLAAEERK